MSVNEISAVLNKHNLHLDWTSEKGVTIIDLDCPNEKKLEHVKYLLVKHDLVEIIGKYYRISPIINNDKAQKFVKELMEHLEEFTVGDPS